MLYSFDGKQPSIGKDTYVSETALVIGDISIGDNCYIGHGAILRGDYGRIEIGSWSIVAEGAVVKMNQEISDNVVVAGNPAKVVRGVEERDKEFWTNGKQIYIDLAAKYLKIGMHRITE